MSKVHSLKTWPEPFAALVSGEKTFEFRRADRDYAVGDVLVLQEYHPETGYTGEMLSRRVTYLLPGGFGIPEGFCCMSVVPL